MRTAHHDSLRRYGLLGLLSRTALNSPACNRTMRGGLATVVRDDRAHQPWQHELPGGARTWLYVHDRTMHLVDVFTTHAHQTR